jgi:hypothetical protein
MKMIQIRNVPESLHRALKERAAREGITLSELLMRELPRIAQRPTKAQVLARIQSRPPAPPDFPNPSDIIRDELRGPL